MPEQAHTLSYKSEAAAAALGKLIRCCLLWPHICPEDKQTPINKSAIFIFFKYPLKRSRKPDLILVESAAALHKTDFERAIRFEIESSYRKKTQKILRRQCNRNLMKIGNGCQKKKKDVLPSLPHQPESWARLRSASLSLLMLMAPRP